MPIVEREFNKVIQKLEKMIDDLDVKCGEASDKRCAALGKEKHLQVHLLDVKIDSILEKHQLLNEVVDMLMSPEMFDLGEFEPPPEKTVLPSKKKVYTAADGTKWVEDPLGFYWFMSEKPGGRGVCGQLFSPLNLPVKSFNGGCMPTLRFYRQVFKTKKVKKGK
jgi:hypothetical protein